ncbi:MAG: DUF2336 domain-containing protein [Rhodospirillaceae bacterium]
MGLKGVLSGSPERSERRSAAAEPAPDSESLDYLFDGPPPPPPLQAPPGSGLPSGSPPTAELALPVLVPVDENDLIDLSGPDPMRAALADRLGRLLPSLSRGGRDKVFNLTCMALEKLAQDEAVVVRTALATAIKDVACAPPALCLRLAQDVERLVAEPILRCCASLSDADLLAILQGRPTSWAVAAIAGRARVSAPVSDAVCQIGDSEATGILLDNQGAVIADDTMEGLVEESRQHSDWQSKLVRRPSLPPRLVLRLVGFVDQAALEYLRGRDDFDAATVRDIVRVARRRIEWLHDTDPAENPERRAARMLRKGTLDEAALEDALSWKQMDFLRAALALRSGIPPLLVDKLLHARSGRAITALAWRAELSMRTAFLLQKELMIPPSQYVYPREGAGYPLSADEMIWQLEFFGVPPGRGPS